MAGRKRTRAQRDDPSSPSSDDDTPFGDDEGIAAMLGDDPDLDEALRQEDEEGEDLVQDAEHDYRRLEGLDTYEQEELDSQDYDAMTHDQRRAAELALDEQDAERARREGGRMAEAFDGERDATRMSRRRELARLSAGGDLAAQEELEDLAFNLEDNKAPIRQWVQMDQPRREIKRRYREFLTTYTDKSGASVYRERIQRMCEANEESLVVSYMHLSQDVPVLAIWVADSPTEMLDILDEVTMDVVLSMFPNYDRIRPEIHVRISDLPVSDKLRDIRQVHLNCLIRVSGVVTRRTGAFPQLKLIKFDCTKCGNVLGPYYQNNREEVKVTSCPDCQSRGPFTINMEETIYRNFQKITLQESPGSVPPGRLPRSRAVVLLWDLVDSVRPGEEIEVTGTYLNNFDAALNVRNGFPVFATVIIANYVSKKSDLFSQFQLTDEDEKQIRELGRKRDIGQRIMRSIAPSIYGHSHIKAGIAMALFGGRAKESNKHRMRGDINLLMLGDPGTAKSQILKYVEATAHRAVFTTGQGASAVGLTASVRKDPLTREWTLEGGALVLADQGVCLIDEFDKMNDQDRTSIHEAMEQQSISVSKAGIITTLQARCSIIAAANPVKGRYDQTQTFAENVNLSEPILSRFDVLCVVKDRVDPVQDERLANFVITSHRKSHPNSSMRHRQGGDAMDDGTEGASAGAVAAELRATAADAIPQGLLRKYIRYAKQRVMPRLQDVDEEKISELYAKLRQQGLNTGGGVPIAVRHIESIIRMSEAHARMHLRDGVNSEDVDMAIRVMLDSFVSAQKYSVARKMKRKFQRYITYKRDNNELLLYLLQSLVKETLSYMQLRHQRDPTQRLRVVSVPVADFEARASEVDISDCSLFYDSEQFKDNGFKLDRGRRAIVRAV